MVNIFHITSFKLIKVCKYHLSLMQAIAEQVESSKFDSQSFKKKTCKNESRLIIGKKTKDFTTNMIPINCITLFFH